MYSLTCYDLQLFMARSNSVDLLLDVRTLALANGYSYFMLSSVLCVRVCARPLGSMCYVLMLTHEFVHML